MTDARIEWGESDVQIHLTPVDYEAALTHMAKWWSYSKFYSRHHFANPLHYTLTKLKLHSLLRKLISASNI